MHRWLTLFLLASGCGVSTSQVGGGEQSNDVTASSLSEQASTSRAVLLQGFHWNSSATPGGFYNQLAGRAADLKDLGVTHVWLPPPADAASPQGYLPRRLEVFSTAYGTEAELRGALSALTSQGLSPVADLVLNHRVGTTSWGDFTQPTWGCSAVTSNDEWAGRCGNADTGDGYAAARDLDHTQLQVRDGFKAWFNTLKGLGFSGMRFDYARGYAPQYAKEYADAFAPTFCVGEVWTDLDLANPDAHRQLLMNWVDGTQGACATFDFTTKGLLNRALGTGEYWRLRDSAGRPAGALGWWPQKQVTFVDNHDTGPSEACGVGQNHWPMPCDKVLQAYAYILTHPGIPTVYAPHVYEWGLRAGIKALISARAAAGVTSTSRVTIVRAESGLYVATIDGTTTQLTVKLGPGAWSPPAGWSVVASGADYAVYAPSAAPLPSPAPGGTGTATFTCEQGLTVWGENVYVVGSAPQLGAWNPVNAVKLSPSAYPTWTGVVTGLPAAFEFKFIKKNGAAVTWESGANRVSSAGTAGVWR